MLLDASSSLPHRLQNSHLFPLPASGFRRPPPPPPLSLLISLVSDHARAEQGLQFAIREGGRTVGAGKVSEVL